MPELQSPLPRYQLVSKVYQTLGYQILCTILCIFLSRFESVQHIVINEIGMSNVFCMSAFLMLLSMLILLFKLSSDQPTQKIVMCTFTLSSSSIVSIATMFCNFNILLMSMILCFIIVVSLNYYASLPNFDSYTYESLAKSLFITYMSGLIFNLLFGTTFNELLIILCGITSMSMYVVYGTRKMLYDPQYMSLSDDDYLILSIDLYLDIFKLFIELLKLLNYLLTERRHVHNR